MAYTSIIPVHRLDNSINYIKDKEKTTKPAASAGSLEEAIDYALNRDKTETMVFEDAIGWDSEAVPVRMRLRICLQLSAGSIKWMAYKGIT